MEETEPPRPPPTDSDVRPKRSPAPSEFVAGWHPPAWIPRVATQGWPEAALGALIATGIIFGGGIVLAFVLRVVVGDAWILVDEQLPIYKVGGLIAFAFERLPITASGSSDFALFELQGSTSIVPATLTGFAAVGVALWSCGRYVVSRLDIGSPQEGALQGAKLGIPFAFVGLIAAFIFRIDEFGFSLGPSAGRALWWSLLLGLVFGGLGGLRSSEGPSWLQWWARDRIRTGLRPWAQAAGGALSGIGLGFVLSLVGVWITLIVAGARWEIFDAVPSDGRAVTGVLILFILFSPNAAVDALVFAHGASVGLTATALDIQANTLQASYFGFPEERFGDVVNGGLAPGWVFLALLIPVVSSVLAGYRAASRSDGIRSQGEAWALAGRVGGFYALLTLLLGALAHMSLSGRLGSDDGFIAGTLGLGVSLFGSFFVPLLWGVAGGYLGILVYSGLLSTDTGLTWDDTPRPAPQRRPPRTRQQRARRRQPSSAPSVRYCESCGAQNSARTRFCTQCGEPMPRAGT